MNFTQSNANRWTIDYLASLSDSELDTVTQRAVGHLSVSRLLLGRCMQAVDRGGSSSRRGLSGSTHYAIQKGIDLQEAREARRVAGSLEALPLLRERAETGRIAWTYLREVTRVATADTEEDWLNLCARYSTTVVTRLVRRTAVGASPLDPNGIQAESEPTETELRVVIPVELSILLARVARDLSCEAHERLSFSRVLECLLAERLAGAAFPGEKQWQTILEEARKDLAAERELQAREADRAREEASQVPAPEVHSTEEEKYANIFDLAVAARENECPDDPELSLVRPAPPHWSNGRLRFSPDARHLTPAQRAEVLRRDAYKCSTPCCPNHVWLAIHHIVFYCEGGVTLPPNLLTVCTRCHTNIHEGRLRVRGQAPAGLQWTDAEGNGLVDHDPQGWHDWDWTDDEAGEES